jgi:hypothetical protein
MDTQIAGNHGALIVLGWLLSPVVIAIGSIIGVIVADLSLSFRRPLRKPRKAREAATNTFGVLR